MTAGTGRQAAEGILDTSAVIDLGVLDPLSLPGEPLVTAVTLAELSVGPHVARTPAERAARQALVQQAEADTLRTWTARVLTAHSLEEVFVDRDQE